MSLTNTYIDVRTQVSILKAYVMSLLSPPTFLRQNQTTSWATGITTGSMLKPKAAAN
jgi:hypothetical protein